MNVNPEMRMPNNVFTLMNVLGALPSIHDDFSNGIKYEVKTPTHKCGLPSCNKIANRGGYCSAEHCKEHRTITKSIPK
jgi:hypothetical protein